MINVLSAIVVIWFFLLLLLLSTNRKYVCWPILFVFFFYFFKPFFSRLIFYFEPEKLVFDVFSVSVTLLFPVTFVIYCLKKPISTKQFFSNPLSFLLVSFIFVYFLEIFNSGTSVGAGLLTFKHFIMVLFSFSVPFFVFRYRLSYNKFVSIVFYLGLVYAIYGLFHVFYGHTVFEQAYLGAYMGEEHYRTTMYLSGRARPFSFASTDSSFWYSLDLIFLFFLPQYYHFSEKNKKLFKIYSILILLLFMYAPERTPVFMLFIGIVTIYILSAGSKWVIRAVSFSLMFVPILVALRKIFIPIIGHFYSNQYLYRAIELLDLLNAETWKTRAGEGGNWIEALIRIKVHPILGYGAGAGTFNRLASSLENFYATHSEYLTIILETGIIGFVFFCILVFYLFYTLLTPFRDESKFQKSIRLGVVGTVVSIMACSVVGFGLFQGESGLLTWLFIGFVPVFLNKRNSAISYENLYYYSCTQPKKRYAALS
jgi:O-antigen ligase